MPNSTKQAFEAGVDWLAFPMANVAGEIRFAATKNCVYAIDIPGPRVDRQTRNASIAQKRKKYKFVV